MNWKTESIRHALRLTFAFGFLGGMLTWNGAANAQSIWNLGASGNWNTAGNWSPAGVPNGSTTDVVIGDGLSTVTMNLSPAVRDLFIGSGNMLLFGNQQDLFVYGTVANNGVIHVNQTGNSGSTEFRAAANVSLSGTGLLRMSRFASGGNSRIITDPGFTLTQQSGHTIAGAGIINGGLINFGLVQADASQATTGANIVLETENKVNHNLFQAAANSALVIDTITVTNTGGTIRALADGEVHIGNGATIVGGTVESIGTGLIRTYSSTNANFRDVTINGMIETNSRGDIGLEGAIHNTGSIRLNPGTATSDTLLEIQGTGATLTGGGTITLVNHAASITGAGATLTIANQTIEGSGDIGRNAIGLANQAGNRIHANVNGQSLVLDPSVAGMTNQGTIEATNSGFLQFTGNGGGSFDNTGGVIRSNTGTEVQFSNGATIIGGILESSGTGLFRTVDTNNVVFDNLTINGLVTTNSRGDITLRNSINNTGVIQVNPGNATSGTLVELEPTGATLTGGGSIFMNGNGTSVRLTGALNAQLTIANQVIRGGGQFGSGQLVINNQANGVIHADTAGRSLVVDVANFAGALTNTGMLRASSQGSLIINDSFTNQGIIDAGALSLVDSNATLTNGANGLIMGSGELEVNTQLVNNGTIAPGNSAGTLAVDLAGTGLMTFGSGSLLEIELASASSFDILNINGNASLDGLLNVDLLSGYLPTNSDVFTILNAGNDSISTLGEFANVANGGTLSTVGGEGSFTVHYFNNGSFSRVELRNFMVSPVPEPGLAAGFLVFTFCTIATGRRSRR